MEVTVPNLYLTVLHCFKKPNGNTTMTITIPTEEHLGVKHLKSYWSFGERREKNSWLQLISNNPWGMTILLSPKTVDLEKKQASWYHQNTKHHQANPKIPDALSSVSGSISTLAVWVFISGPSLQTLVPAAEEGVTGVALQLWVGEGSTNQGSLVFSALEG